MPAVSDAVTTTVTELPESRVRVDVQRAEPSADPEAVDAEVEQLRDRMARLETKDGAAVQGDYVVMDYVGSIDGEEFEGGAGRDQLLELGSSTLIPGFEEQLQGA